MFSPFLVSTLSLVNLPVPKMRSVLMQPPDAFCRDGYIYQGSACVLKLAPHPGTDLSYKNTVNIKTSESPQYTGDKPAFIGGFFYADFLYTPVDPHDP